VTFGGIRGGEGGHHDDRSVDRAPDPPVPAHRDVSGGAKDGARPRPTAPPPGQQVPQEGEPGSIIAR
jgi:hypothetical protein